MTHPLQHQMDPSQRPAGGLRERVHEIIYEADTPAGKAFDLALIVCILLSVAAIMLESMSQVALDYGPWLVVFERVITVFFTIEYVLRLWSVRRPMRYATSFYGVVDLLAILPTYLAMLIPGAQTLAVVRVLRMMRVFRVLKLGHMVDAAGLLRRSLFASRHKIMVFLLSVATLIVIIASLMYAIEGAANGFTSIPRALYWTIVTITTVGYGDITPRTEIGQVLAALVMLLGYTIIAVPTGIVSAEIAEQRRLEITTRACPACGRGGHELDSRHCKHCGAQL
jgi:voltage-gated potassium channel